MTETEMKQRTKVFALRVIKLVDSLPNKLTARRIGDQLVRAGTSVASNYRAACRGRSRADFNSKLGIVEEEAEIDDDEDRMVAYKIDARCAKETLTAGTMVCSEKAVCYLV
jgi:hypothetical protein